MKSLVARLFALPVLAACGFAPPAQLVRAESGEVFTLKVGESVRTKDGAWEVGFEGVSSDSRCPKGERCVWAGDAVARVWVKGADGERSTREIHTSAKAPAAGGPSVAVRVVSLEPQPIAGRTIAKGAYVVTLGLERDASRTSSDR